MLDSMVDDSTSTSPDLTNDFSSLPPSETITYLLEQTFHTLNASREVEEQLERLAAYRAPLAQHGGPSLSSIPKSRLASVLVLLHLSRDGQDLNVTLTTRSKRLRSHPGETSLPGGKFEPLSDTTIEQTALREANEEIALPLSPPSRLLHLTNLAPYTSRTLLLVVPCVYLLVFPREEATDWLKAHLRPSPDEVEAIFDSSLTKLLLLERNGTAHSCSSHATSTQLEEEERTHDVVDYTFIDYSWPLSPTTPYRLHSFACPTRFVSPITGLTADILIDTASIAQFGPVDGLQEVEKVGFVRRAEGQAEWREICERALRIERTKGDKGRGIEIANSEGRN
ncbi:NUDIX hydrolase [Sporobolomyces salmoneus]|uniref:NUDIX hydrolase n=1 Tax=Sporobolomyces salmoneus TaxID=183962 RepID=UPI003177A34D